MRLKRINYRHYICVGMTIGILALSFLFVRSYFRIGESLQDLFRSVVYYFTEIFYLPSDTVPTINDVGYQDTTHPVFDVLSFNNFKRSFEIGFSSVWNIDTVMRYLNNVMGFINGLFRFILIMIPFVLLLIVLFRKYFTPNENEVNEDSKALKFYKILKAKIFQPIKRWIIGLIEFVKENKVYKRIWIILFLLYFNIFTIGIEFLAFYFYFVVSFDFFGIFEQIYKLFLDLIPLIRFVPVPVWILFVLFFFDRFRKKIAYQWLYHLENRNKGFINSTGQVTLICGEPGTGKTTALTDFCLSQEVMFRDKAFEKILENDLKFPNFPYAVLEQEFKMAMDHHQVYSLSTAKKWIGRKKRKFESCPTRHRCFDYDYETYGLFYDDGLKIITLFDMLENYVQLYFIYVIESSLIISNYGIREDNLLQDQGHFPLWHSDFFHTDARYMEAYSRHSHILDFDMLRLGKTIVKNNRKRNAFEFGVVAITEGGKERGNSLENQGVKKESKECNPKNDLFNKMLKMIRHSATVDNFPFIKILIDEQRASSFGADDRELCEKVLFIKEKKETSHLLAFFRIETMIHDWLYRHFQNTYYQYRFNRSDNTLFLYLFKNIVSSYHHYYMRLYNTFGYNVQKIDIDNGRLDGIRTESKYYLLHKKIYAKRFATDAFSDYFRAKAWRSKIGIGDIVEFETERATLKELESENSYFIIDLMKKRKD